MTDTGGALPISLAERAARNERWIVLTALALATAVGLFATLEVGGMLMLPTAPDVGAIAYGLALFLMWWSMMLAMMLPSAAPAILTYGAMRRKFLSQGRAQPPLLAFVSGYGAIWTAFSLAAVTMQIASRDVIALTGMMAAASAAIGGVLLAAAGIYQLTPLKQACLRKCQTPLFFFARNWREGAAGALRMGLSHGLYCLGCCWVLMLLLFYGGVMEAAWIVGLALYVAAEKLIPAKFALSRFAGIILIVWGGATLFGALS